MVEQLPTALVVVLAVAFAVFQAQPAPPQSPLLYQWETDYAHWTVYEKYRIFFKDVQGLVNNSRTLVVLHGFPTSSFDFHMLLKPLRNAFSRVVFIDFLGHGFSDKPRNHQYSLIEQTKIVEFVLQEIGVSELHILAHDYGGSVAMELLKKHRDTSKIASLTIESLAIINPSLFSELYRQTWFMYLLRLPIIGPIAARLANRVSYAQELDQIFGSRKIDEFTLKQLWYFARHRDEYRAWPSLLSYLDERPLLEKEWLQTLKQASIPMAFFHGPASPILPYDELSRLYSTHVPSITVEKFADDIGHYPQFEDPEELFERYVLFLRGKAKLDVALEETVVLMTPQNADPAVKSI
ncbi:mesoderm-specific transcript protein [Galendromus occidentalis]|uniref:Mesoderm-specific transcript protein n=1 Tax=Galendromus occidentalis TaxID=34638 RepID=A0AAJ6VX75_9ACAR|nr:mesoderm-specific transcript protein [Galendromus occidentalis]